MGLAGWSNVSAWFIKAVNSVLSHLQFEKQLIKIISKAENTSEHKNQTDIINNTARAMQLEQSKQYDQWYGQSDAVKAI